MKKILTMLALTLTLTSFAFAGETINKQALNAFQSEFAGATDIAWKVGSNYSKSHLRSTIKDCFPFLTTAENSWQLHVSFLLPSCQTT